MEAEGNFKIIHTHKQTDLSLYRSVALNISNPKLCYQHSTYLKQTAIVYTIHNLISNVIEVNYKQRKCEESIFSGNDQYPASVTLLLYFYSKGIQWSDFSRKLSTSNTLLPTSTIQAF